MKPLFFRSVPFILLLSLLFLSQTANTSQAAVLYATESAAGSGNCLTWSDACTLVTALTTASTGDKIWVATFLLQWPSGNIDRLYNMVRCVRNVPLAITSIFLLLKNSSK